MKTGESMSETKAQTEGAWLRSQACQHIQKHRETFINFFASQPLSQNVSFNKWVENAALASTWVDGLLIHSLACKLGTAIVIWKASQDQGKRSWQRYCFAPKFYLGKARTAEHSHPIAVVLRDGHYVPLRSPVEYRAIPDTWLREAVGHFKAKLGGAGKSASGRSASTHSCRTPSVASRISKAKSLSAPTVHSGPGQGKKFLGSSGSNAGSVATPSVHTISVSQGTPSVHTIRNLKAQDCHQCLGSDVPKRARTCRASQDKGTNCGTGRSSVNGSWEAIPSEVVQQGASSPSGSGPWAPLTDSWEPPVFKRGRPPQKNQKALGSETA